MFINAALLTPPLTDLSALLYILGITENELFHSKGPDSIFLSFFLSIHTATPSLEDYEQAYIVHTGFAG